jgi:hypothetical protein
MRPPTPAFRQAGEKYEAALKIKPDSHEALTYLAGVKIRALGV